MDQLETCPVQMRKAAQAGKIHQSKRRSSSGTSSIPRIFISCWPVNLWSSTVKTRCEELRDWASVTI
jgi:hypothetical protein